MTDAINDKCLCSLPPSNIYDGQFICVDDPKQVVFRASIYGTLDNPDPSVFVDLLEKWIQEEENFLVIGSIRLNVDQSCPAQIDSFLDPECVEMGTSGQPVSDRLLLPSATDKPTQLASTPKKDSMTTLAYTITGAVIGVLLFITCIILLIIFLVCLMNKQANKR